VLAVTLGVTPAPADDQLVETTVTSTIISTFNHTVVTTLPAQIVTVTSTSTAPIQTSTTVSVTTLPAQVVTLTSTSTASSTVTSVSTFTLNPPAETVTTTQNITQVLTTSTTVTTTRTKPQAWTAGGATINPPLVVDSVTFVVNGRQNLLQIGSYTAFSTDYDPIVKAVLQSNNIFGATFRQIGTVKIDSQNYQYQIYTYRDLASNTDRYAVVATRFYPDALRTYYILYETLTTSTAPLTEMQNYLATYTTK